MHPIRRALLLSLSSSLIVLMSCADTEFDRLRPARAPVVYGTDDRTEVYAHSSAVHRAVAETAIAMELSAGAIDESNPANVRVTYSRTLREAKSLCDGERFADQIEPGTCSGTLIDARHLVTAAHCVDEARDCDGSRVWLFGFRYASAGSLAPLDSDDVYRCRRVLAARDDSDADHAVVELDRDVVGHTPALVRRVMALPPGTELVLIGHPNGIPMKIASGGYTTRTGTDWLEATVDAFSGNSGSGVFDTDGNLVAILDSGETDYVPRGDCNVVNVIDPPPTDDGEGLTYVRPAMEAYCATPGIDSPVCDCDGPCVEGPAGDLCADADVIEPITQSIRATLVGYAPDVEGSCGGEGPERVYSFTLTGSARLTATASGFDTVLYLRAGCDGSELACNDDISDDDRGSRIEADLDPGTYTLFADAYDAHVDALTLDLTFEPLAALDGGSPRDAGTPIDDDASTPPDDAGSPPDPDASTSTDDSGTPPDAGPSGPDEDASTPARDAASPSNPGAASDDGGCAAASGPTPSSRPIGALICIGAIALVSRLRRQRAII